LSRRLPFVVVAAAVLAMAAARSASAQIPLGTESPGFTFRFNVDYFFQVSSRQSLAITDERFNDNETFFWERLRPKVSGSNGRVSFLIEAQDTHSRGSEFVVRKAWLDLLNAYVDLKGPNGLSFRIGRRQGDFDAIPRLVRTPDFAAVVRSFDLIEARWQRRQTDVRAFVFRTVDNLPNRFNTWKTGERLWTASVQQGVGRHRLQTYVTTRLNTDTLSESSVRGSGAVYAWQTLASGPTGVPKLDYLVEHVLERGHASTDRVKAYGLFASLGSEPISGHDFELRYVRTSGDQANGDGIRGAYDIFYMAIGPLSPLGLMRGPNLNSASIGATHQLAPKFSVTWRLHEHRLNTLNDGWYSSRFIKRTDATSPRLGIETDAFLSYTVSRNLTARVGYFRLSPGAYVRDSGTYGAPYEVRVQLFGGF
jgi:hypothetical protein